MEKKTPLVIDKTKYKDLIIIGNRPCGRSYLVQDILPIHTESMLKKEELQETFLADRVD